MNDGRPQRSPGITNDQMTDMFSAISGKSETDVVIAAKDYVWGKGDKTTTVDSEEQLNAKLAEMKASGKLPIIVQIDSNNRPFLEDSGLGKAGGSGGMHVVTITDYHPGPPPKVDIDNQWGKEHDHIWGPTHSKFMTCTGPCTSGKNRGRLVHPGVRSQAIDRARERRAPQAVMLCQAVAALSKTRWSSTRPVTKFSDGRKFTKLPDGTDIFEYKGNHDLF